jgi:hypothetical protein
LVLASDRGCAPKAKLSLSFCYGQKAIGDILGIGTSACEGESSISWAPFSVIMLCGREPRWGKNIRGHMNRCECQQECVVAEGNSGGSIPFEDRFGMGVDMGVGTVITQELWQSHKRGEKGWVEWG